MPQRISNDQLAKMISVRGEWKWDEMPIALDLRDARAQNAELTEDFKALARQLGETREHLKLAIEGLELAADQNDAAYPKQIAQTYLDRIKGIG